LRAKLDEFIRKFYKNELLKGALYSAIILSSFFILSVILEYFGRFDTAVRTAIFYTLVFVFLAVVGRYFVLPLLRLYNIGKTLSYEDSAKILGAHFSQIDDKLLNVLQLHNLTQSDNELLLASINQKVNELKPLPFSSAINLKENLKYVKYVLVIFISFSFSWFAFPEVVKESTKRILHPKTEFLAPLPYQFLIENKDLKVAQNEDFLLEVKVKGNVLPEEVFVEIGEGRFKLQRKDKLHYSYLFKNVNQSVDFILSTEELSSSKFSLQALPKATIAGLSIKLSYPAYLHKASEVVKNTGDLFIPEGTNVEWTIDAKNTEQLLLKAQDSIYRTNLIGSVYSLRKTIFNSTHYSLLASNSKLLQPNVANYFINVQKDAYPEIGVVNSKDSTQLNLLLTSGEVADDYGISKLTFNYRKTGDKSEKEADFKIKNIAIDPSSLQQEFNYFLDVKDVDLKNGESLEYFFEVWDNDGVNGHKSVKTKVESFRLPGEHEIQENMEKAQNSVANQLKDAAAEADKLQKEYEQIRKDLLPKKNLDWADKKKIKDFLKKQNDFANKVEDLKKQNEKLNEQKEDVLQPNEDMLKKQDMLQDLMEKLLPQEMKEQFKELEKLMDEMSKEKTEDLLEKINLNNKELEKDLDRSLELFKQMEFEEKLDNTVKNLEKIAKEQKELSEKTKNADKKDQDQLKEKQDELNKQFEDVKKDLQDLKEKNSKMEFPRDFKDPEQQKNEAQNQLNKASENLEQKQNKSASENQKNAADKMEEMAKQMAEMKKKEEQQKEAEDMNALRQILENLLYLSFEEEKLMNQFKQTSIKDPNYVRLVKRQNELKDDAKIIEDSLFALSKRQVQLSSVVNKEIGLINENLKDAIAFLGERQTPQANEKQRYVMTSANNLALMLDESLQQMQKSMAEKKFGQQKCNKPGGGMPQMSDLKQMQEALNKQLQEMKNGENPGGKSGTKGSNGESGDKMKLAKMAAQQSAIRQYMQEMSKQLEKEGKGMSGSGMNKLNELMKKTEQDIVNNKVTTETIQRQKEILTRMLEAEKAMKEREYDKERKANEGKDSTKRNQNVINKYKWHKKEEDELLKTVPPVLNIFYKKKANEYFNAPNDK
jgi:hypothetical protein